MIIFIPRKKTKQFFELACKNTNATLTTQIEALPEYNLVPGQSIVYLPIPDDTDLLFFCFLTFYEFK